MKRYVLTRGTPVHRALTIGGPLVLFVIALIIPQMYTPYRNFQFTLVFVYAIAVFGLNLLTGYNGQISLGHSAFFAVGAYTAAVLIHTHGWNYLATLPVGAALAFILGLLFGIPALRLHGLHLALVTVALAIVTPPVLKRFGSVTGGSQGLNTPRITAPEWTGLADDQWVYYVALVVMVLMLVLGRNIVRGRVGRAMVAVRDNEIAASTMGVNLARTKTLSFAYSAMYAGVAGVLYTYVVAFVAPDSFSVVLAIGFVAAMVVGGLASISGAIFGALFIEFVPVYASDINQALSGVIYGGALILFMFVAPFGLAGLLRRIRARFVLMRTPVPEAEATAAVAMAPAFARAAEDAWINDDGADVTEAVGPAAAPGGDR